MQVTSNCLFHGLRVFFLHAGYELLFNARVVVIVILSANLDTPWFILNIGNTSSNLWKFYNKMLYVWSNSAPGLKIYVKYVWKRPESCGFIKKKLQYRCFPVKFAKLLRKPWTPPLAACEDIVFKSLIALHTMLV